MKLSNLLHRGFVFLLKNKEIPADTALFSAIYGAKKFDSGNYRKTIQRLKDALENFITHQSLQNTKKDQHLLIALDKLGQKDWLLDASQDLLLELTLGISPVLMPSGIYRYKQPKPSRKKETAI